MLIKWCKVQYLNLNKAFSFSRNQVICLINWKFWQALTAIEFNIFCWNFAHVFVLPVFTKGCLGLLLFCLGHEQGKGFSFWLGVIFTCYFFLYISSSCVLLFVVFLMEKVFLANDSSSKQNKKSLAHPFVDIVE